MHELSEVTELHSVKEDKCFLVDNTDDTNRPQQRKQGQCGALASNSRGVGGIEDYISVQSRRSSEEGCVTRWTVLSGAAQEQETCNHLCRPIAIARLIARGTALLPATLTVLGIREMHLVD